MIILLIGIAVVTIYLFISVLRKTSVVAWAEEKRANIRWLAQRSRQDSMEIRLHKFCPIGE